MLMSIARTDLAAVRDRPQVTTDEESSKSNSKTKCEEPLRDEPPPRKIKVVERSKGVKNANRKLWDYMLVPAKQERPAETEIELTEQQMQEVTEENRRLALLLEDRERLHSQFLESTREILIQSVKENIALKEISTRLQIGHLELFDDLNQKQQQLAKTHEQAAKSTASSINGLIRKAEQSQLKAKIDLQRTLADKNKRLKRMQFYQSNCSLRTCVPAWPLLNGFYQPTELVYRTDRVEVYKALNVKTLQDVAVKLFYVRTETDLQRLEQQYALHSKLDHPNLLRCVDFFQFQSHRQCVVYEWAEHSLQDMLAVLDEKAALEVAKALVEAIRYLRSKQIVHRNIRTNNLLIVNGSIKLGSFGWAVQGTIAPADSPPIESIHLPPELKYSQTLNDRLDVWSLGVVLYECLAKTSLSTQDLPSIRKLLRQLTCSEQLKRLLIGSILTQEHQRCSADALPTFLKK